MDGEIDSDFIQFCKESPANLGRIVRIAAVSLGFDPEGEFTSQEDCATIVLEAQRIFSSGSSKLSNIDEMVFGGGRK